MTYLKRQTIPQRDRIFFAGEGESEQAYGRLLADISDENHLNLSIDVVPLGHGLGNAREVIVEARKKLGRRERQRGAYKLAVVFVDHDKYSELSQNQRADIDRIVRDRKLTVIWQLPDHEGFLLRHFETKSNANIAPGRALEKLQKVWPNYEKPMTAKDLAQKISLREIERASCTVPGYVDFLKRLKFPISG
jgi:hypothetical protein